MMENPTAEAPTCLNYHTKPLSQAMLAFLCEEDTLFHDPKRLLDDELSLYDGDNTLKLALLKMVRTLVSIKNWVNKTPQSGNHNEHGQLGEPLRSQVSNCLTMLDIVRDTYVWEQLNVGHWKTVAPGWRRAYTFLCICKTIFMAIFQKPSMDIIKECDMGLLMGEPITYGILDNVLLRFAQDLSSELRVLNEGEEVVKKPSSLVQEIPLPVVGRSQCPESRFEIELIDNPSLEHFLNIMKKQCPVLISGGIDHWPARRKWNIEYICKTAGFRTVPVELGSKYTSDDWTQKLMRVEDFVNSYILKTCTNITKEDSSELPRGVGYIAQHRLFEQITELGEDIKVPDYCFLGESKQVETNAWFGPGNTVSPNHYDPKHNLLAQVFGAKLVRLYPPSESQYLRPFPATSILFNTSQVDLDDPLVLEKYPDLRHAKYCEFILSPGSMLYIPPKWWHYITSLTPSFSISFWFE